MRAIVTVMDDTGRIIERNKEIHSIEEYIDAQGDYPPTRTAIFKFAISECLSNECMAAMRQSNNKQAGLYTEGNR